MVKAEAFAYVVKAKRIGQRQTITPRDGGLIGLNHHVKDPASDKQTEEVIDMFGKRRQHRKDSDMRDALGKLAIVHGADARHQAQQARKHGVGCASGRCRRQRAGKWAGVLPGVVARCSVARCVVARCSVAAGIHARVNGCVAMRVILFWCVHALAPLTRTASWAFHICSVFGVMRLRSDFSGASLGAG